jgi:hypothetical protein
MSATISTPCLKLPKLPQIPNIKLMGGAELKGFADFSLGPPTDCKLTFNLLLQLSPLLASMACLFKILNVFSKLKDFADAAKNPFKLVDAAPGLIGAIGELSHCIPALALPDFVLMIKGILNLVISFLSCFLNQLDDILKFQASIDLKSAEGNPTLKATLLCAQDNAKTSMDNLMMSLQPLEPILQMVGVVVGIAGLPALELPDVASISSSTDQTQTIESLAKAVDSLKTAISSLPG